MATLTAPQPQPPASADWPTIWAYIMPAIDHIMCSPSNEGDGSPPKIDAEYHMGIYSAIFNYSTTSRAPKSSIPDTGRRDAFGIADPPQKDLDQYYANAARVLLSEAPEAPSELIPYVVASFDRYSTRAAIVSRMFSYYNRHWVRRASCEGRGWMIIPKKDRPEKIEAVKRSQLKQWGFPKVDAATAEARAEAGTSPDRIVRPESIALRRFRSGFIEPMLGDVAEGEGQNPNIQGKLKTAVEEILQEGSTADEQDRAKKVLEILTNVGMRRKDTLIQMLEVHVVGQERGTIN
ncbi:hypothetical protein HWV62_28128 [Athelia sp. TMB]|nr:hypothetical protein HWV62_28128 [Athelia sp. TMB]